MRFRLVTVLAAVSMAVTAVAQDLSFQAVIVGGSTVYVVRAGDTLASIGARFGASPATLAESNRLVRPNVLEVGQPLVIDNSHIAAFDWRVALTINVAQRMLFYAGQEGVTGYPVAVGRRSWPTPTGAFTIVGKETDPAWDVPLSIQREMEAQGKPVVTRMEPSPLNPLGAHWIRLSLPNLGIHGTNAPSSIYSFSSHGCIRMHPDDVAGLFTQVTTGTPGVLIYQPVILAVIDRRVWLEAHRDEYRRAPEPMKYLREVAGLNGVEDRIDWPLAADVLRLRQGRAVDVTRPD